MHKMSLNAFDKTYEIVGFKHSMFRDYESSGYCYPKSGLVGGFFQVEFASDADVSFLEKMVMIEWGERNFETLSDDDYVRMNCFSGKLSCHFDEGKSGKVYEWKHAIVMYYEEIAHSFTGKPMKTRVVFSPFDLRVNNLLISRYSGKAEKGTWYFDEPEDEKTIVSQTEEPNLLELYYTDEKGNRIDKEDLQPNTVVYLVIKGQNLAGKTGDLELSNAKVDFEHQGVYLENDILENYALESDYNKIELKVIKPKND